jgi:hypothetical protein
MFAIVFFLLFFLKQSHISIAKKAADVNRENEKIVGWQIVVCRAEHTLQCVFFVIPVADSSGKSKGESVRT